MTKVEWQIYDAFEDFKRFMQVHIEFSPMALSNFHHLSDRLLDERDGSEKAFNENIKNMLKNGVKAKTKTGTNLILNLEWYIHANGAFKDFDKMFL